MRSVNKRVIITGMCTYILLLIPLSQTWGQQDICNTLDFQFQPPSLEEVDSIINLCQVNRISVEDELVEIGAKILCGSIQHEYDYGIANGHLHMGLGYYLHSQIDSAILCLNNAYNISLEHDYDLEAALSANWLGLAYQAMGHYDLALSYQQDYSDIGQEMGNKRFQGEAKTNMGSIYHSIGDLEKAMKCHQHALGLYSDKEGIQENFLWTNRAIAMLYAQQNQPDQSLEYFQRAMRIGEEMNFTRGLLWTLNDLIRTYVRVNIDSARHYQARSKSLIEIIDNNHLCAEYFWNEAQIEAASGSYSKAFEYGEQCLNLAQEHNLYSLNITVLEWLSKLANKTKRQDKELKYLRLIREGVTDQEDEYRDRTLAIWAENQNKIIEHKSELLTLKEGALDRQRRITNQRMFIVAGFAILLGLFIFIYYNRLRNRDITNNNRLLEKKNESISEQLTIIEQQKKDLQKANVRIQEDQNRLQNELSQKLIHLANKQEIIDSLGNLLQDSSLSNKEITAIKKLIRAHSRETIWEEYDNEVAYNNKQFFANLAGLSSKLTSNDYRLAAMIRINLSNKEIARLQSKSLESIHMAKSRLRKKLNLSSDIKLESFFNSLIDEESMA